MANILNIEGEPIFDDSVVKIETHTYNPYANTTFAHNDEIRIPIQQQDLYTLPCESFLYVEGRLVIKRRNDDESQAMLVNNCAAFMFDEIRYELNGVEIDRNRNVGITSTIKNYVSLSYNESQLMRNAGWDVTSSIPEGYFNFCVPLNDNNCIIGDPATEPEIELFKVQWRMPHVTLNEVNKLSLLRALGSGRYLSVSFRSWDLYEYPLLQSTTKHSWAVKTATQLEKPRYVIFALQTGRKNIMSQNYGSFLRCIMIVPTFVDLKGFIVGLKFVAKEAAVLRNGTVLEHYIFTCPMPWSLLTKSDKSSVLGTEEDDEIPTLVYVKRCQKRNGWWIYLRIM
ncbi:uncharacterized protein LOC143906804 [Temnothorax americanus]|uniref:uncharacterized protein LOC143906804 n=1 Tax=Temnothorax americanus TaxID=1964332 RepID=UPI004067E6F3